MNLVTAYIILKEYCEVDHIFIQLEQKEEEKILTYSINPPKLGVKQPGSYAESDQYLEIFRAVRKNAKILTIEINENIYTIADSWYRDTRPYYDEECKEMTERYHSCMNNCADSVAYFLEKYADIPKPKSSYGPNNCSRAYCCFFLPSFLPVITTPGYVYTYANEYIKTQKIKTEVKTEAEMITRGLLATTENFSPSTMTMTSSRQI